MDDAGVADAFGPRRRSGPDEQHVAERKRELDRSAAGLVQWDLEHTGLGSMVEAARHATEEAGNEFQVRSESANQARRQANQARAAADEVPARAEAERAQARQALAALRAAREDVVKAGRTASEARRAIDALRRQCDDLAREIFRAWQVEHPGKAARRFVLDLARRRRVTEQQMYRILLLKRLRRTEEEMHEDLNRILTGRATLSVVARERGITRQAVWAQFQKYLVTSDRTQHAAGAS